MDVLFHGKSPVEMDDDCGGPPIEMDEMDASTGDSLPV